VLNFHSRPHDKNPESEILAITNFLRTSRSGQPIILAGDFNVDQKEPVFEGIKGLGYSAAITNQRTTLKRACKGAEYLNYAIDNIFYSKNITKVEGNAIDFVGVCDNLERARTLSDHLPVFFEFSLK
tara:strand:- start:8108 stop:8488 length:381 start_codon:yes stop_codon:yes gene_type:complete